MNARQALGRSGFAAAACVACCAPPMIAALGLTAGVAATAAIFVGLAAAIAVVLAGGAWILTRARRHQGRGGSEPTGSPVLGRGADARPMTRSHLEPEAASLVAWHETGNPSR